MSESKIERLAEIQIDFFNAIEAATVSAKRQIAGIFEVDTNTAVKEETFTCLKFETQQGAKIGAYAVAYQPSNIEEKFQQAYNILRSSNATIKDRYHGAGYIYSYWLYGQGKIYRQKMKNEQ